MFDFLSMMGTYELRKIARYDGADGMFVSTARITDSDQPYETAICHPFYNKGKIIIVEMYDIRSEAEKGHKKWVNKMTSKKLPISLKDVSTASVVKLVSATGGRNKRVFKKTVAKLKEVT